MKISKKEIFLHSILFLLTFFTVTLSGVVWLNKDYTDLLNFQFGIQYSISIILILLTHELGHYFAAKHHGVDASLPYFIPFPISHLFLNFGTLGAFIKTKTEINNLKKLFDIGAYGPIAGFVTSIIILIIGFLTLPDENFILSIHPDYFSATNNQKIVSLSFGSSLLFDIIKLIFANPELQFVPPMSEIYHYPLLCAGWFGLFITMMNLIPVGQLDGGHIIYSMFPEKQNFIAKIFFAILFFLGISSFISIYFDLFHFGWSGWLIWALILFFIIKLPHPEILDKSPIDKKRKIIGWITILIFILTFIPAPFPI